MQVERTQGLVPAPPSPPRNRPSSFKRCVSASEAPPPAPTSQPAVGFRRRMVPLSARDSLGPNLGAFYSEIRTPRQLDVEFGFHRKAVPPEAPVSSCGGVLPRPKTPPDSKKGAGSGGIRVFRDVGPKHEKRQGGKRILQIQLPADKPCGIRAGEVYVHQMMPPPVERTLKIPSRIKARDPTTGHLVQRQISSEWTITDLMGCRRCFVGQEIRSREEHPHVFPWRPNRFKEAGFDKTGRPINFDIVPNGGLFHSNFLHLNNLDPQLSQPKSMDVLLPKHVQRNVTAAEKFRRDAPQAPSGSLTARGRLESTSQVPSKIGTVIPPRYLTQFDDPEDRALAECKLRPPPSHSARAIYSARAIRAKQREEIELVRALDSFAWSVNGD